MHKRQRKHKTSFFPFYTLLFSIHPHTQPMDAPSSQEEQIDQFSEGLYRILEKRGELEKVRGSLRASLFHLLERPDYTAPTPPPSVMLVNQLIKEYLTFMRCENTLSVFEEEAGSAETVDRSTLEDAIGFKLADQEELPLLLGLVDFFKTIRSQRIEEQS